MDYSKIIDTSETYQVQLHLCLKSPPWDRYPACHPTVLSCNQQTFALSKVHEVSNTNIKRDINTAVLLSSNSTPSPLDVSVTRAQEQKGDMNPLSSINTPSWRYTQSLGQSNYTHQRACKNNKSTYKNHA